MDKYKAIRPYSDEEVPDVLDTLLKNDDFIDTFASLRLSLLHKLLPSFARFIVKRTLKNRFAKFHSVADIQALTKNYVDKVVDQSTDGLSFSGVDSIDSDTAYLFISTHRDIVLDASFLSLVLMENGAKGVRIATGDNLLEREFIGDVMRLNKSFIVKRNISKPRQLLVALLQLSGYIRYSINEEKHSVWIAQKEGRSKDGLDKTEAAIIKMLTMSAAKDADFFTAISDLNIVPIAISYEYNPCDQLMAKELYELEKYGSYTKAKDEDVLSIFTGIQGNKGRVHVAFGKPLNMNERLSSMTKAEEVAELIDQSILESFVLYPCNFFAYKELYGIYPEGVCCEDKQPFSEQAFEAEKAVFEKRVAATPEEHRLMLLTAYANPLAARLAEDVKVAQHFGY